MINWIGYIISVIGFSVVIHHVLHSSNNFMHKLHECIKHNKLFSGDECDFEDTINTGIWVFSFVISLIPVIRLVYLFMALFKF